MKVTLRATSTNAQHTRAIVFLNGVNCGELCMKPEEAVAFYMIVQNGCHRSLDQFLGQGKWSTENDEH